ncbi:MAG: hypothetical protein ABIV21_00245 [Pyrinomonadaceae bacterium]
MEDIPGYVSVVFILTTFACIAFLLQAIKTAGLRSTAASLVLFLLPLWLIFQAVVAIGGFYLNASGVPPRLVTVGVMPANLLILACFIFFRRDLVERMPIRVLTLVHVVRIPVEIVLLLLYNSGTVPQVMTFEGLNFDILSGILAPVAYLLAFRGQTVNKWVLVVYNIIGLALLANIVSIAILSLPSPVQRMAFDQPNVAVLYFPYIWLPTIVVPIVLFSHLTSLWKLATGKTA